MGRKRALISGITGQDGAYLAELLLKNNYEVYGASRNANAVNIDNLAYLGIADLVTIETVSLTDVRAISNLLERVEPDEFYHLAGQSSVGLSFDEPIETWKSIAASTINILESIRRGSRSIRFYHAGSSEVFGNTGGKPADERTAYWPCSPYGSAKAAATLCVRTYREAYGLFACTGILFNHESPLRPDHFVTKKIVAAACRIAAGSREKLRLGNLEIRRDWGWAPEYVESMCRMLQQPNPDDYVIATGISVPLQYFVEQVFEAIGREWRDYVEIDTALRRPAEIAIVCASPAKASDSLGWRATSNVAAIAKNLIAAEIERSKGSSSCS